MVSDSLEFPREPDDWLGRIAIGGLLGMLNIFIIPIFFRQGYLMQILRETEDPNTATMPEWDDWGKLLTDGLTGVVGSLVFLLPPYILLIIGGGMESPLVSLLGGLLLMVGIYMVPAALANLFREDDFTAIFDLEFLKEVGLSSEYFVAHLLAMVVGLGASIVILLFVLLTLGLGALLTPFMGFYLNVVFFHIYGTAITEATTDTTTASA